MLECGGTCVVDIRAIGKKQYLIGKKSRQKFIPTIFLSTKIFHSLLF